VVPFPISVLAMNAKGEAMKQYLIWMEYAVDDSDEKAKIEALGKVVGYSMVCEPRWRVDGERKRGEAGVGDKSEKGVLVAEKQPIVESPAAVKPKEESKAKE
jgi:hypothetical protein